MKGVRLAASLVMLMLAGGCSVGLDSKREPTRIYTLAPPSGAAEHNADLPGIRLAGVRSAPGLDTDRILLRRDSLRLDHFAGARWAADAPALVEDYLEAVLVADGDAFRVADDAEAADFALTVEVRAFEADYRDGDLPVIRVDLVAVLRDEREQRQVLLVRRTASQPAAENTLGSVARAFDNAMEVVAAQISGDIETAIGQQRG